MVKENNDDIDSKVEAFLTTETKRELAEALDIEYKILSYNLYKLPDSKKYTEFEIPKRNGGKRLICAPNSGIKYIQKKLSEILLEIYPVKSCVHSYIKNKGIVSNSEQHKRKKFLVNIDLKDFFPSINFGRVRGIFKSHPFKFEEDIATTLAQICCYKKSLPQGAPTSPILSNYVCRKLDNQLMRLAKKNRFTYSRYADDITFSTNVYPPMKQLGIIKDYKFVLSKEIKQTIEQNDFKINTKKIRYATKYNRQVVTGLTVNEFSNVSRKYINNIRAMLNAWEKYGLEKAAEEHFLKYNHRGWLPFDQKVTFEKMLAGKIGFVGMVRGKDNEIYQRLCERIKKLSPEIKLAVVLKNKTSTDLPIIFGEGKTDWKHLKAALRKFQESGDFRNLNITFQEYENNTSVNNEILLSICKTAPTTSLHKNKIICVFDRDVPNITSKVKDVNKDYKAWGNNVYSFALPIPDHRSFEEICIEHFYLDKELKTNDAHGRRIFMSNEFDQRSGRHLTEDLNYTETVKLKKAYPFIISDKVYNRNSENVALSKEDFARYILDSVPPFANFTFEHFRPIFEIVNKIIELPTTSNP